MSKSIITFSTSDGMYRIMYQGMPVMADTSDAAIAVSIMRQTVARCPNSELRFWGAESLSDLKVTIEGEVIQ